MLNTHPVFTQALILSAQFTANVTHRARRDSSRRAPYLGEHREGSVLRFRELRETVLNSVNQTTWTKARHAFSKDARSLSECRRRLAIMPSNRCTSTEGMSRLETNQFEISPAPKPVDFGDKDVRARR